MLATVKYSAHLLLLINFFSLPSSFPLPPHRPLIKLVTLSCFLPLSQRPSDHTMTRRRPLVCPVAGLIPRRKGTALQTHTHTHSLSLPPSLKPSPSLSLSLSLSLSKDVYILRPLIRPRQMPGATFLSFLRSEFLQASCLLRAGGEESACGEVWRGL